MTRQCGECTLCCKLVPVAVLEKPAGVRCKHMRHSKGCGIYEYRPKSCRVWSCAWLLGADTDDIGRPDRSHCVIDQLGTMVHIGNADGLLGKRAAVQIWCDPAHRDAYLHPTILAFIRRRGAGGLPTVIRYGREAGLILIPPEMSKKGWIRFHPPGAKLGQLGDCTDVAQDPHGEGLPETVVEFGMKESPDAI